LFKNHKLNQSNLQRKWQMQVDMQHMRNQKVFNHRHSLYTSLPPPLHLRRSSTHYPSPWTWSKCLDRAEHDLPTSLSCFFFSSFSLYRSPPNTAALRCRPAFLGHTTTIFELISTFSTKPTFLFFRSVKLLSFFLWRI